MDTRQIIDYAAEDNGVEFRNALYASIHDKVTAHIEAAKQAVAQNYFRKEEDSSDEWEGEQLDESPKEIAQLKKKIANYDKIKRNLRWGKMDPLNDPYGKGGSRSEVKSKSKGTAATNRTLKSNIKRSLGTHAAPRLPEEESDSNENA